MAGFDHLLAGSLNELLRENLGNKTIKKIEARLFEKFGVNLTQAIEEFEKIDLVLREFFGKGADGIEKKIFENLIQIKSKKSKGAWHTITDSRVNSTILESFGDPEKKKILESVTNTPKIVADILSECNLSQTSGYRKINHLIQAGLLVQSSQIVRDNKKINVYVCIFNNLKITIEKGNMVVDVQLSENQLQTSSIVQIIQN